MFNNWVLFFKEIFNTFGVVAVGFTANSLHLFNLTGFTCGLDIFEVNLGLLAEIDDATQEVKKSFKRLELLKQINESTCGQLLMILGGNLHNNLQILANIGL